VLAHTFIEGLHPETKIVVDAAVGGQVLEKSFDKIYALLNKFSKRNLDLQGEMGRHIVQKSVGVLELDVVSAFLVQVATLANQVNKMTLVINKQQAQPVQQMQIFCEVCGEGNTSDLCPTNPESICFVGNANRGQTNKYGNTGGTTQTSLGVETKMLGISTCHKLLNSNIDHHRLNNLQTR